MARSVTPISDETFQQIALVLGEWGEQHPSPDLPILMTLDGSELTPRDIKEAMYNWAHPAARTMRMLFSAALSFEEIVARPEVEVESLQSMLEVFRREIAQFRSPL